MLRLGNYRDVQIKVKDIDYLPEFAQYFEFGARAVAPDDAIQDLRLARIVIRSKSAPSLTLGAWT